MAKHVMVVLTNAVDGQDEEFNRWYDERHLADVVGKGPFEAATRFELAGIDTGTVSPYRYLALYEIADDRLEAARDWILWSRQEREEALAAGREPAVPMSAAITDDRQAWFFTQHGERFVP